MKAADVIGYGILFVFVMVFSTILNGFVLSTLWSWFIVPAFDLPVLRIPEAIGLAMVVGFLTYHYNENEKNETGFGELMLKALILSLFRAGGTLGVGFIIQLFM